MCSQQGNISHVSNKSTTGLSKSSRLVIREQLRDSMKDAILFDITDIILYLLTMHENEFLNAIHGDVSTL